jgi:hypothetical protein
VGPDKDIVSAYREAEREIERLVGILHSESSELERSYREVRSRYEKVIGAAEQRGYEKGLADHQLQLIALTMAAGGKLVVPNTLLFQATGQRLERYGVRDPVPAEVYEVIYDQTRPSSLS